jgi:hypothetical protein
VLRKQLLAQPQPSPYSDEQLRDIELWRRKQHLARRQAEDEGKRQGLEANDVLMLNRQLLEKAGEEWTDDAIRVRTQELARLILRFGRLQTTDRV